MKHFSLESYIPALLAATGQRFDSASTAMFLRELTYVYQQTYDVKYADTVARKILAVDNRVNPGAESFVWRQYNHVGTAKVVDSYAEDFPNVEIFGAELQTRIVSLGASYQYTMQDMRAASMAGLPLETRKAEAARKAIENAVEAIAAFGDAAAATSVGGQYGAVGTAAQTGDTIRYYGLTNSPSILNAAPASGSYPGVPSVTNTNYTSLNWTLNSTAVSDILGDVNAMQNCMFTLSLGVHKGDTLLLPTAVMSALATKARSVTFTDDSILQYIQKQSPWIKEVIYWPMLDVAGLKQDGVTVGPRVMLIEKKPENQQLIIPQEFEQLPPQMVNMAFKIPCHMRIGGVSVRYPLSVAYLDGTTG
jgi:hypothetical protein